LTPNAPLTAGALHQVFVTAGVTDPSGNSASPFSSTFTTAVDPTTAAPQVVAVSPGSSCSGAELACNDDFSGVQSGVSVALAANQTIIIVVDGYSTESGNYTLHINGGQGGTSGGPGHRATAGCAQTDLGNTLPVS